jgi:hypothetical protein
MATVLVSYNMSFASDAGMSVSENKLLNYPSEMSFLAQNQDPDKRLFWNNAAAMLFKFIGEMKDSKLVIGLQEMNKTENSAITGSSYIATHLPTNFFYVTDEVVVAPTQKPALMTIWDDSFGDLEYNQIYELAQQIDSADGSYNSNLPFPSVNYSGQFALATPKISSINQPGRPIMFTYTTKGYLLINIQATNVASDSAANYANQLLLIQDKFAVFSKLLVSKSKVVPSADKIFVMGDFNDRYNGLKNQLMLSADITLRFDGKAPLSCCHNLDSSCSVENYTNKPHANQSAIDCVIPAGFKPAGPRTPNEIKLMGAEGNVGNYRYYGDYCFAANSGPLEKYPTGRTGPSTESDHEMVYMVVNGGPSTQRQIYDPSTGKNKEGGRRRRRTRKHRKCSKRRRPTRRGRGRRRSYRR